MSRVESRVPAQVLGMALFVSSEVMFFGSLFAALFTIRARAGAWPPNGTPEIELFVPICLTGVLLASSVTQHLATAAYRSGDRDRAIRAMAMTLGLALLFLGGEAWEWSRLADEGFTVSTNSYGTLFYGITGAHGLHVALGVVMLAMAIKRLRAPKVAEVGRRGMLEAVTLYWHFVDAVWLAVFSAVYLLASN